VDPLTESAVRHCFTDFEDDVFDGMIRPLGGRPPLWTPEAEFWPADGF
jgi:hypothetical protein